MKTGDIYQKDWWQIEAFKRFEPIIDASIDAQKIYRILDLGCGNGVVTKYLRSVFPNAKILGIDSNEEMISYAKQHHADDNIEYVQMDIRDLENFSANQKFDLIHANYVLHWLLENEKQKLFENLRKITAPSAFVMIGTCQRFPNFLKFIDENIRKYFHILQDEPEYVHYFSLKQWRDFLLQNKFLVIGNYQNLDMHPILLSENIDDPNNFLKIWLWGASAGKAAYSKSSECFSKEFIKDLVNKSCGLYGTENYYKNDQQFFEIQNFKYAVFEEETLYLIAQKMSEE